MTTIRTGILFLCFFIGVCYADNLGKLFDPPQRLKETVQKADLIKIRTAGIPAPAIGQSQLIMEIRGQDKVQRFLAPFQLFAEQKYAAGGTCDCTGDPTIEVYCGDRLITSFAIKKSTALYWPDNWPAEMLVASMACIDQLNEAMAKHGFPRYRQEKEEIVEMARRVMNNQKAVASGNTPDTPIRKIQKEVQFDTTGWQLVLEDQNQLTWYDDKTRGQMVFIYARRNSDEPDPRDLDKSRAKIREGLANSELRLVEAESLNLGGVVAQWIVMKGKQNHGGFSYQADVIIQLKRGDLILNIMCSEIGITGVRESAVLVAEMEGKKIDGNRMVGFYKDPYDSRFDEGALYAISDDEKYDSLVPNHPLSQVRRAMRAILSSLKISDEIRRQARFQTDTN